ncbi:MAG: SPOR domain-containing protein [Bacteroidota bacterium]|nr:SPOR domain-containing protein [Bacteroidota bacterium]
MNKTIRLALALAVVMLATSACKTKQKIAEIPAGANIEAKAPKTEVRTPVIPNEKEEVKEAEVTRNENFSLVDGDKDALKYKYYVVVGSFSKQTNAKGLQTTLIGEGNKAIIVVNEKGMFRVLINSFNDYNLAHARIREIANRFPDAWVLVQK